LSGRRKKVVFDQTQNERGRLDTTYSELGELLRDQDFDVEPYNEYMILAKNLKNVDVFVLGCPNSSKVRPQEIDVLHKFVKEGGGLLLLSLSGGDRGLMNNMSKISEEYGVTFDNTAVKDDRNNAGLPTMPIVSDIAHHMTTEDVSDLLIPSACSLRLTGEAKPLATTSEMAEPPKATIVAVTEEGKGRVMCVGSYEVFRRGGGLKHKNNKTFAVNTFRWLAGEVKVKKPSEVAKEERATEEDKKASATPVQMEEFESTLRRLVNAVFDLQKDIEKVTKHVEKVDDNVEMLRNQFQDFAEKTQQQLGVMIPAKQFKTAEESKTSDIEADLKALDKEFRSLEQLREHVEQRHTSGAMPNETYLEQIEKLDAKLSSLMKRKAKKEKELEQLKSE
jgi:hypothetical protein